MMKGLIFWMALLIAVLQTGIVNGKSLDEMTDEEVKAVAMEFLARIDDLDPGLNPAGDLTRPPVEVPEVILKIEPDVTATELREQGLRYANGDGVKQDAPTAVAYYKEAHARGDIAAAALLATCYLEGRGVRRNFAKAATLFQEASDAGDLEARTKLALLHMRGKGVQRDWNEAAKLLKEPVDAELPEALYAFGRCWHYGMGSNRDSDKAVVLFRKAAEAGYPGAMGEMGWLYRTGQGVPVDLAEAVKWWRKGAELKDPKSLAELGNMYHSGYGVPESKMRAVALWAEAMCLGGVEGMRELGDLWMYGHILTQDFNKGSKLVRAAYEAGDPVAASYIGLYYANGSLTRPDYYKAAAHFQEALKWGGTHHHPLLNLGISYLRGRGVKKNLGEARRLFEVAAERNEPKAMGILSTMHANGDGVPIDYDKAVYWARKGAELGDPLATNNLGAAYYDGHGVAKDRPRAIALFRKAAEMGDKQAQENLVDIQFEAGVEVVLGLSELFGNEQSSPVGAPQGGAAWECSACGSRVETSGSMPPQNKMSAQQSSDVRWLRTNLCMGQRHSWIKM